MKAGDLTTGVKLTVKDCAVEEIVPGENKPVLFFEKTANLPNFDEPAMVLNQTNANMMSLHFTGETDKWRGKEIGLYVKKDIEYKGDLVPGLRIRVFEDEPTFSSESDAQAYEQEQKDTANTPDFNDDIEFGEKTPF